MSTESLMVALNRKIQDLESEIRSIKTRLSPAPINLGAAKELTIDSGSISVTRPHVVLVPETGTTDDLDEILPEVDGKCVLISTRDSGDTITIRTESVSGGNIHLPSAATSRVLADPYDSVLLIFKAETGFWEQVSPQQINQIIGFNLGTLSEGEVLQVDGSGDIVNGSVPPGGVPAAHASTHQDGGSDEVATDTPTANAIPKASASGKLDNGWLDATLASLAALGTAADKYAYTTAIDTWAEGVITAYGRSIINAADAAAVRIVLELVAGSAGDIWVEKAGDTMSGALAMGTNKITGLGDPTAAQDAATKAYVDAVANGLDVKASVRVATTANITLSGTQTIDGVGVIANDRVLVKNQSTAANNGIYVCAAGAWARATDADASAEVTSGMFAFVTEGTINGNTGWALTTDDPITVGTTALTFSQFSGPTNVAAAIDNASETTTPADANKLALVVSGVLTWLSGTNLKAYLKTYFDTLYQAVSTAVLLTTNQSVAGIKTFTDRMALAVTTTTGAALSVVRDLTSGSTDSPVVSIHQDNAGDDQDVIVLIQDGSGDLIGGYAAATKLFRVQALSTAAVMELGSNSLAATAFADIAVNVDAGGLGFLAFGSSFGGTAFGLSRNSMALLTSGLARLVIGTSASAPLYFGTNGTIAGIINASQNWGLGTQSPLGRLHVYNGVANFLEYANNSITGTAVTIVPDGFANGDVVRGCYVAGIYYNTAGDFSHMSFSVANGASQVVQGDTLPGSRDLTFAVAANGALTVQRTAGTQTWTIAISITWF